MNKGPLVPFFEGETRIFYKYPMSIWPYLVLPKGFELYWQKTPEIKSLRNIECYNRPGEKFFELERKRWVNGIKNEANSRFDRLVKGVFQEQSDYATLFRLIAEHGLFNYNFFRKKEWERISGKFGEAGVTVDEVRSMVLELPQRNPNWQPRGLYMKTERNALSEIFDHLYEQTLFDIVSDKEAYIMLESWFDNNSQFKQCQLCKDYFRVIDIPHYYYYGSNGCYDCCFGCLVVEKPSKTQLKDLVPTFVNTCGFIPTSKIGPTNYGFMSRISPQNKISVFRAYAQMGGIDHIKSIFGSWFQALAETNTLPSGVLPTARGVRCLAEDGHVCLSLDEQFIDNWLHAHNIPHKREPYYPSHSQLNPNGKRRADWKVGNTLIEYFGLIGDEEYEQRITEKMLLAEKLSIKIISVYSSDLSNLDERFSELFKL